MLYFKLGLFLAAVEVLSSPTLPSTHPPPTAEPAAQAPPQYNIPNLELIAAGIAANAITAAAAAAAAISEDDPPSELCTGKVRKLWRVDRRNPFAIRDLGGFFPRGWSAGQDPSTQPVSLLQHVLGCEHDEFQTPPDSGFVSTTCSENAARRYAIANARFYGRLWIYEIAPTADVIDVAATLGAAYPESLRHENEFANLGPISWDRVRAFRRYGYVYLSTDEDGSSLDDVETEYSALNTDFDEVRYAQSSDTDGLLLFDGDLQNVQCVEVGSGHVDDDGDDGGTVRGDDGGAVAVGGAVGGVVAVGGANGDADGDAADDAVGGADGNVAADAPKIKITESGEEADRSGSSSEAGKRIYHPDSKRKKVFKAKNWFLHQHQQQQQQQSDTSDEVLDNNLHAYNHPIVHDNFHYNILNTNTPTNNNPPTINLYGSILHDNTLPDNHLPTDILPDNHPLPPPPIIPPASAASSSSSSHGKELRRKKKHTLRKIHAKSCAGFNPNTYLWARRILHARHHEPNAKHVRPIRIRLGNAEMAPVWNRCLSGQWFTSGNSSGSHGEASLDSCDAANRRDQMWTYNSRTRRIQHAHRHVCLAVDVDRLTSLTAGDDHKSIDIRDMRVIARPCFVPSIKNKSSRVSGREDRWTRWGSDGRLAPDLVVDNSNRRRGGHSIFLLPAGGSDRSAALRFTSIPDVRNPVVLWQFDKRDDMDW